MNRPSSVPADSLMVLLSLPSREECNAFARFLKASQPLQLAFEESLVSQSPPALLELLSEIGITEPTEPLRAPGGREVSSGGVDAEVQLFTLKSQHRSACCIAEAVELAADLGHSSVTVVLDERLPHCADPEIVREAQHLEQLAYEEAEELFRLADSKLSSASIQAARERDMELRVVDVAAFASATTRIAGAAPAGPFGVRALVLRSDMAVVNIRPKDPAANSRCLSAIFSVLGEGGISLDFSSHSLADKAYTIALDSQNRDSLRLALAQTPLSEQVEFETAAFSAVGIVGSHMRHRSGVSGKVFETLAKNGVSVAAIAQSSTELSISILVKAEDAQKALSSLHDALFLSARNQLNCMIVGPGSIGSELLEQIEAHRPQAQRTRSSLRVVGISNSKRVLFDRNGISRKRWLDTSTVTEDVISLTETIDRFIEMNLPNSVLIDCTASEALPAEYDRLLSNSISVVTPNKRGLSDSYESYIRRHALARRYSAKWYYETTVGAGLPIIGTIHDLLGSGDRILKIEAILSGTLSYLFNTYDASDSFAALVRDAQRQGITEPDPRDDLNGADVARKLLILARESGYPLELDAVKVDAPVPAACLHTESIDDFYRVLEAEEKEMAELFTQAANAGQRLRYIGTFEEGHCEVQLTAVGSEHPFYELSGTDNILAIRSERYSAQPLVIRGPGAGVSVTAAGVFADVLRVASYLE